MVIRRVINIRLDGHMSWSRGGWKSTSTDAPSASLFGRKSGTHPRELLLPETPREREGSRTLEPGLGLSASLQFLSFFGVPLQVGRAINARPICCKVCQVTVTFRRGATLEAGVVNRAHSSDSIHGDMCMLLIKWLLEVGAVNRVRRFGSDPSRHI